MSLGSEDTMKINRFSCKCKLCKEKWTTEVSDRAAAFNAHAAICPKYAEVFAKRRVTFALLSEDSEKYQISALFFNHQQIEGRYAADIKCDGRCMSATGHSCDCSCGGVNHGAGSTL